MGVPTKPSTGSDSGTPVTVNGGVLNCPSSQKPVYLKVEIKTYFRIRQQDDTLTPDGKGKNKENRRIGGYLEGVLDAEVEVKGENIKGKTANAKGNKYLPAKLDIKCLRDGTYTLQVKPHASRKSEGPAGPATHGKTVPKNGKVHDLEARMYRPVDVSVRIEDHKAVEANTVSKVTYANAWVKDGPSDTVFIDLKPDWWSSPSSKSKSRQKDIDLIVLHNTGSIGEGNVGRNSRELKATFNQAFTAWCAHYYVDLDGHVVKIFHEADKVAYHAMYTWAGELTNDRSVGIEICRPFEGFQLREEDGSIKPLEGLRKAQFDSVVRLIEDLQTAYGGIRKHRIIGHCDSQKESCPGCDFWWELLEAIGQGMVLQEPSLTNEPAQYTEWFKGHTHINAKASEEVIGLINTDLEDIGYEIKPKKPKKDYIKQWSKLTKTAVRRFQYHFYSGFRYHLRFEYTGKPAKLKDPGVWPKNGEDGGKAGGKEGQATPGEVDRNLALRIRAVADYVRKANS